MSTKTTCNDNMPGMLKKCSRNWIRNAFSDFINVSIFSIKSDLNISRIREKGHMHHMFGQGNNIGGQFSCSCVNAISDDQDEMTNGKRRR